MSQPIEVYPNTVARQSSPNPNGSFEPVFVVLAIIFVLSAVACVVGRFCGRQHHHVVKEHHCDAKEHHHVVKEHHRDAKEHHHVVKEHHRDAKEHHQAKAKQIHHPLGPKEWESRQKPIFNTSDGDIEFGFDKKIPTPKKGANGISRGPQIGGFRREVRFADNVV